MRNPTGFGVLQVEPTDHCNLRCQMCAPHAEQWAEVHGVAKGYLSAALWERICAELVEDDVRFDHVIFQWLGDPSLHPELPRLVGAAAHQLRGRVGYLRVDTNAILLPPERAEPLLLPFGEGGPDDAPPLLLVFTIDAQSGGAYALVKGRDALELVRRNIRGLLRLRRRLGARVNVQVQFVVQEGNADEAGAFLAYWRDLLACQGGAPRWHDEILFKRLSVAGGGPGQAAADDRYEATMRRFGIRPGPQRGVQVRVWERRPWQSDDRAAEGPPVRTACPGLWLTPVIRHDGVLVMCCADLGSRLQLGSLHERRFRSLWEGPVATAHRLDHLAGRFEGPCQSCGGINWYDTTPAMAQQARRRGRQLGLPQS